MLGLADAEWADKGDDIAGEPVEIDLTDRGDDEVPGLVGVVVGNGVTRHTVVYREMVSVVRWPIFVEQDGDEGGQVVIVYIEVV